MSTEMDFAKVHRAWLHIGANASVYGVAGIGSAKNEAKRNVSTTMDATIQRIGTNLRNVNVKQPI